jgi:phytoene synthase
MTTDITSAPATLASSRLYCRQITRQQARNFYYGLALLAEPKRSALFALYAWMRHVDDLADDEDGRTPEQRLGDLENFRQATHAAFDQITPDDEPAELWPAFSDMVRTYSVPREVFDDAIAGHQQDVQGTTFQTFEQLREYCYRVAGTVGLASLYIWGFEGGENTKAMAIDRGIALQLTNILRDLSEDASRSRVYLSADDLAQFGMTRADILTRMPSESFEKLIRFEIARAESYFNSSAPLESLIQADCRATLSTMTNIYHRLLEKISTDPLRVLRQRISLSMVSKIMIAVGASWGKHSDKPRVDANGLE